MRYFTNSPFERLMQEVPNGGDFSTAVLPETHPCYGCAHYGGCCFALCHRKPNMPAEKSDKAQE